VASKIIVLTVDDKEDHYPEMRVDIKDNGMLVIYAPDEWPELIKAAYSAGMWKKVVRVMTTKE